MQCPNIANIALRNHFKIKFLFLLIISAVLYTYRQELNKESTSER